MKPGNKSKQEVQSHNRNKLVIGENIVIERAHQIKKGTVRIEENPEQ